jgi:hypothetical protein
VLAFMERSVEHPGDAGATGRVDQPLRLGSDEPESGRGARQDEGVDMLPPARAENRDDAPQDRRDDRRRRFRGDGQASAHENQTGRSDEQSRGGEGMMGSDGDGPLGAHERVIGAQSTDEVGVRVAR